MADSQLRASLKREAESNGADTYEIPGVLFDTKLYTSGTTTQLTFFDGVNAGDFSLTNYPGASGLPANTYFRPTALTFDILANATAGGAATAVGILNDIQLLMLVGRPYLAMKLQSMTFKNLPLSFCHASGGAIGTSAGTLAAASVFQQGNNGVQDGGFAMPDSMLLGPQQQLTAVIAWTAAQTLNFGNPYMRLGLVGKWYLPV